MNMGRGTSGASAGRTRSYSAPPAGASAAGSQSPAGRERIRTLAAFNVTNDTLSEGLEKLRAHYSAHAAEEGQTLRQYLRANPKIARDYRSYRTETAWRIREDRAARKAGIKLSAARQSWDNAAKRFNNALARQWNTNSLKVAQAAAKQANRAEADVRRARERYNQLLSVVHQRMRVRKPS